MKAFFHSPTMRTSVKVSPIKHEEKEIVPKEVLQIAAELLKAHV